jgi:preprotein translocase subunit YajC
MITPSFILGAAPLLATSSKKSSSSSSSLSFLVIILLLVAVYFFFFRPRQQRAKAQAAKGKSFGIGDEVMSVGGIYGRVVGLGDESVDVEVAPGVVLTFLNRAVNPRPASALSGTSSSGSSVADPDDQAHPYGGSGTDGTSFGSSSGHFDTLRDGDDDGEDDFDDFEDEEDPEAGDFEDEDEAVEGADDGEVVDQAGEQNGNGHQHDDQGSSDGSATRTPRPTGGSRSEDD